MHLDPGPLYQGVYTYQVCFGNGVSKSNNHYSEKIGARIWEDAHGKGYENTCDTMDGLKLSDGFGPNKLVISVLHGFQLNSLLHHRFLGLSEEIRMRDIWWKNKVCDYGDKASNATFKDEKV